MKKRILVALLVKEIKLLKSNPYVMRIIFAMPFMIMLVVPLITTLDVKSVDVAVVDNDRSQLSRRIVSDMASTGTLKVMSYSLSPTVALEEVSEGLCDVILTIPRDFSKDLSPISIEANGVNATKGLLGSQYVAASVMQTVERWTRSSSPGSHGAHVSIINRFNPTLEFRNYMIPALMVMLIIIICGFLPTLSLVNEKETGTLEAINVTPVGKFTFVLSKLIPYWVIGVMVIGVGILVGWLVYGLVPVGSIAGIFLAAILFSLVLSGLGVTIANRSSTMIQSIFVMFAVIMIFQLMGGLFTPITSMPGWAQNITIFVPPRYFIEIMRSLYLKGTSIADLWIEYSALALFAITFCTTAALTYRKQS